MPGPSIETPMKDISPTERLTTLEGELRDLQQVLDDDYEERVEEKDEIKNGLEKLTQEFDELKRTVESREDELRRIREHINLDHPVNIG